MTPQPPSCNFIRYRTTRQLPDALTTNPGISRVRAEPSPRGLVEATFTSFSNFDKLLTYICVDEHYILLARYRGWHTRKAFVSDSREACPRAKTKKMPNGYRLPATTTLFNDTQSDVQFRRLVRDLLTVTGRLELARDYFGRRINLTGPQYNLLMTVAELQGATGVSVGSVAQAMHVSSSFVTAETRKVSAAGLLRKQTNPSDRRGALLKLTPLAHTKVQRLIAEIRAVNDLFFGLLTDKSFIALCASAEALVEGSRDAMQYIARIEENSA